MAPPAAPMLDKYGKPASINFLDVFLGTGPRIERSNRGMNFVMPKNRKAELLSGSSAPPTIPPPAATTEIAKSAPQTEAPTAPATEAPGTTKPIGAVEVVEATKPAENNETDSTISDAMAWTAAQDTTLLGMKVQGRSWKEIHETMPEKSIKELKQRFRYFDVDQKGKAQQGGEVKGEESSSKEKIKENEIKKTVKVTIPEEDDSDASAIDPGDFPEGWTKPANFKAIKKGILKIVEVDPGEEEPTQIRGRPIVYMQPEDKLTESQMQTLYKLTRKNDGAKWLEVASRFFDKTGKRLDPELLKAMLKNL